MHNSPDHNKSEPKRPRDLVPKAPRGVSWPHFETKDEGLDQGINPLLGKAAPILRQITSLSTTHPGIELPQLQSQLLETLNVFELNARHVGYATESILLGRFILFAVMDECIIHSTWIEDNAWDEYQLTKTLHGSVDGNQRFFQILEKIILEPKFYLDLLELMYICLSLGFEGPYRYEDRGSQQLRAITDDLYQIICRQRGDYDLAISPSTKSRYKPHNPQLKPPLRLGRLTLTMGLILIAIYSGFTLLTNAVYTPVYHDILHLTQYIP